ncbi:MAG TPA: tetratricopeptide repeat protein [Chromatiales bacterium]|nr:tetratricopeptide repeat protein [Chromatiales bacterium]HEX22840.1 tetratricopeptide repeat protein [Chromatiales bacterium]
MTAAAKKLPAKQDFEALTTILSVSAVLAIAALITTLPEMNTGSVVRPAVQGYSIPAPLQQPSSHAAPALRQNPHEAPPSVMPAPPAGAAPQSKRTMTEFERRVTERFQQAVAMLHAKQYDYAITALDAVLEMSPDMPEAYVNMGYAFIGLEEYGPATKAFERAIDLRLNQYNAYYGLAVALEGLNEYEAALGAMRSYIHLAPPDDPYITKARAALWEWEAQLGRLPGVQPAPEGVEPDSIKSPQWSEGH